MDRIRFQVYVKHDTGEFIEGLCEVYGWNSTEVVDRLVRFYRRVRGMVRNYEEVVFDSGDSVYVVTNEYGEECVIDSPDPLVLAIKEGLVPPNGFESEAEEDLFDE